MSNTDDIKQSEPGNSGREACKESVESTVTEDYRSDDIISLDVQKMISDAQSLSYDELLQRFESLLQLAESLPIGDIRHVAENLLAGAEELLLRQDETGTDFAIAIVALNEQANRQLLAVIRKAE